MDYKRKQGTSVVAAVRLMPEPKAEPPSRSLEGKTIIFVLEGESMLDLLTLKDAGHGSAQLDYPSFFENPGRKADILILADIQLLQDATNMEALGKALEAFRNANPRSAVVVDASAAPQFKGLAKLHEDGKINAVLSSPSERWGTIEIGLEVLSLLRD